MVEKWFNRLMKKYGVKLDEPGIKRVEELYELNFELMVLFPECEEYKKVERELDKLCGEMMGMVFGVIEVSEEEVGEMLLNNTSWIDYFQTDVLTNGVGDGMLNGVDGDEN